MTGGDPNHDAFLASMTFAKGAAHDDCACDECGASEVPAVVREAVRQHLLKRKLEQPLYEGSKRVNIIQRRELVKREGGFSVWKLSLPIYARGGDPIVEYRNNHRILFVKRVSKTSVVLSVGQGIIGSAAEENSRKRVEWATGSSYFLPCSKGIACGWIHKLDESGNSTETYDNKKADSSDDGEREVIVYALKVSPETLLSMDDNLPDSMSPWVKMSHNLFSKCIANLSAKRTETEEDDRITNEKTNCVNENPIEGISMSAIESVNVRDIIRLVEEEDVL